MSRFRRAMYITAVLALLVIISFSIQSSSDSSAEDTPAITIDEQLVFNDTYGAQSADKINQKVGYPVCSYSDGDLCFHTSVIIRAGSGVTGTFLYFSMNSGQGISVDSGAFVIVENETSVTSVSPEGVVVSEGRFIVDGKGTLAMKAIGTGSLHGLVCKSGLSVNNGATLKILSENANAVYTFGDVSLKDCYAYMSGGKNGIEYLSSGDLELNCCDTVVSGSNKAYCGVSGTTRIFVNISVSYSASGEGQRSLDEDDNFTNYRYVATSAMMHGVDGTAIAIAITVIFIVIFVAIFVFVFVKGKKRKSREDFGPSYMDDRKVNEDVEPPHYDGAFVPGQVLTGRPYESVSKAPTYYGGSEQRVFGNESGRNEISVRSEVENESFVISIDGKVIGYIGPQTSVLDAPTSGMHEVLITTSDGTRKQIYRENIMFYHSYSFIVKKSFNGYKVEKR